MDIKHLLLAFSAFFLTSCGDSALPDDIISSTDAYSVYADSVVQGGFIARAVSPTEIVTNYSSPADKDFSPVIKFRFSFNSRDNELKPGFSHYAVAGIDKVFSIGVPDSVPVPPSSAPLPYDFKWTVKVNMAPVLRSFKKNGVFVTATGDSIFQENFRGIWIAGGSRPLSWAFDVLHEQDQFQLKPSPADGDSIYSATIVLNQAAKRPVEFHSWKIDNPNPDFPSYSSNEPLVDALYNMAIDNIVDVRSKDGCYFAGESWQGVWTRDLSYSAFLALAYLDPQNTIKSLKAKVKNGVIVQDTGTGGSWPVSTDRVVWCIAAWEVYKVTGDKLWLKYAFDVIRKSVASDKVIAFDRHVGLMHGEQSFLDWREQSYPKWMQPKDIFESMCLGTNVLFARTFSILADMADILKADDEFSSMASSLKDAINQNLWREEVGYYSEYLYGGIYPAKSPAIDNLGQALSVIWDIADDDRAETLMEKTPVSQFGTMSIYPRIKDIPPYHNDAVWPFVQAFWNIAAAKVQNEHALRHGLGALYRAAALFATHKELFVASSGDFFGTEINSNKQLWSSSGNVAMIFRVFAGMDFQPDGIQFSPFVPACIRGTKTISGFKYRNAVLNISIEGTGHEIESMTINGKKSNSAFFPAKIEGDVSIVIKMKPYSNQWGKINLRPIEDMPATPCLDWNGANAFIYTFEKGTRYDVFANNRKISSVADSSFSINEPFSRFSKVYVVPKAGKISGFFSKPRCFFPANSVAIYQLEHYAPAGCDFLPPMRAARYVEVTPLINTDIVIPVTVNSAGSYLIDVRYANGNGPITTQNKCAVRQLLVNSHLAGGLVMPQRGSDEWYNTGFSNMIEVDLLSGENWIQIKYDPATCSNMNGVVNNALIDYLRLIKK